MFNFEQQWLLYNKRGLLQLLNENSDAPKLKYKDTNGLYYTIYKFEHKNRKEPDIYALVPIAKKRNKPPNLYYKEKKRLREIKKFCKTMYNNTNKKSTSIAVSRSALNKFMSLFKKNIDKDYISEIQTAIKTNDNFGLNFMMKQMYHTHNLEWHESRRKIDLVFFAFQKQHNKLRKVNKRKLCIKKWGATNQSSNREINFMQHFKYILKNYKPQWIDLYPDYNEHRVNKHGLAVVLMKYLGPNLKNHMENDFFKNDDKKKKNIIYRIAQEIQKMHKNNIMHGDLKPSDITINPTENNKVTIIDPGFLEIDDNIPQHIRDQVLKNNFPYHPPDILDPQIKKATRAFDIYSFGVVIWEIHGGKFLEYISIFKKHKPQYKLIKINFAKLITANLKKAKVDNRIINLVLEMVCDFYYDYDNKKMMFRNYVNKPDIDEVIKRLACRVNLNK